MAVSQWVSTVSIVLWSSRAFSSTLGGVLATVQEEKMPARTRPAAGRNRRFFMAAPSLH